MHLCICVWVCVCVCECVYLCVSMWKFAYLCICVCVCERQIRVCRKKHNKKTQTNQRLQINKHTNIRKGNSRLQPLQTLICFFTHTCVYWFVHLWVFICSSVCVYYLYTVSVRRDECFFKWVCFKGRKKKSEDDAARKKEDKRKKKQIKKRHNKVTQKAHRKRQIPKNGTKKKTCSHRC